MFGGIYICQLHPECNMRPLRDALQNITVRGNNCEVWPWRAGDKKWSETAGRVARQRSLATRCLSPAKQRVLGPDLVSALGLSQGSDLCSGRRAAFSQNWQELMKSPWIPKVSVHGGGETTSNARSAAVREWVCCSQEAAASRSRIPVCYHNRAERQPALQLPPSALQTNKDVISSVFNVISTLEAESISRKHCTQLSIRSMSDSHQQLLWSLAHNVLR